MLGSCMQSPRVSEPKGAEWAKRWGDLAQGSVSTSARRGKLRIYHTVRLRVS
jgi:hypothetical protein